MVNSNERGRAFEHIVRQTLLAYTTKKKVPASETERAKARGIIEGKYFSALDSATKQDFVSGAQAFTNWVGKQRWLDGATKMILDRIPDDEAKGRDPTDIRLSIIYKGGKKETKNISVKHHHAALCHPRLPSLAQQCGYKKSGKIDKKYRESYKKIWEDFYSKVKVLKPKPKTYAKLDRINKKYRYDWLYEPLQRNTVQFLRAHANDSKCAASFFKYLVGSNEYYVLKNETNCIEVKHFVGIKPPTSFHIAYPWHNNKTTFLMEFGNGWEITMRLHTASSRIENRGKVFMTEKEDPICQNLDKMLKIEKLPKN